MQKKFTPNGIRTEGDVSYIQITNPKREVVAEAIVDTQDIDRLVAMGRWRRFWDSHAQSYYVAIHRPYQLLHRVVTNAPKGSVVDHINYDTLDCRSQNLRVCSNTQNLWNRSPRTVAASSEKLNVSWSKQKRKWVVRLRVNNEHIHIGVFVDLEEANQAAIEARKKYRGEFSPKWTK